MSYKMVISAFPAQPFTFDIFQDEELVDRYVAWRYQFDSFFFTLLDKFPTGDITVAGTNKEYVEGIKNQLQEKVDIVIQTLVI